VAGCATSTGFAGRAGATASLKLTFEVDHSAGANQQVYEHADPPTRALGTDTPGRAHPSVGTARSAMEQTDWHDASERVFLEKLARRLDAALTDGETTAFIVIAAPRALGMIRSAYTPAVNRAVRAEISRDYVKMPVHEIEKTFSD
jgi:protein required for attachment to host cells